MSSSPEPSLPDSAAFEASLAEVETALQSLKDRYAQVQRDRQRREALGNRYEDIRRIPKSDRTPELQDELNRLGQQLEDLSLALESDLFTWSSLKEPFWQAVRFGGAGIVIGWVLKAIAG
jgi:DNA repair exonuclease SbcCD ATPase subunit